MCVCVRASVRLTLKEIISKRRAEVSAELTKHYPCGVGMNEVQYLGLNYILIKHVEISQWSDVILKYELSQGIDHAKCTIYVFFQN